MLTTKTARTRTTADVGSGEKTVTVRGFGGQPRETGNGTLTGDSASTRRTVC